MILQAISYGGLPEAFPIAEGIPGSVFVQKIEEPYGASFSPSRPPQEPRSDPRPGRRERLFGSGALGRGTLERFHIPRLASNSPRTALTSTAQGILYHHEYHHCNRAPSAISTSPLQNIQRRTRTR